MLRDISNVLISEERIRDRVHEIGAQIAADFEGSHDDESPLVLLPVMTGALVFSADLIRHLPFKLRLELVAISSYPGKSMASKGAKMASELPKDLEGKHVIIVDDILDSGHTIAVLKSLIAEQSPASIKVCVMLEKQRNDGPPIAKADYVGFAIPDEFVVGYGLDYDGYYRNHPEIVTLREDALQHMSQQPIKAPRNDVLPAGDSGSAVRIDLSDGEEVILVTRPHWLYLLLDRPGVSLFLFAVCIGVWFITTDWLTRLCGVVLLVCWLLWQLAERQSRTYVLTSRRVVSVAGLLRQRVVDAPIRNVRQVTMYKSIPERVLGLGSLGFATAGTGGQDVVWRLVERPGECFSEARKLIDPKNPGEAE